MTPSLLILSSVLYIGLAGSPALVDDDVGAAHALVGREMLQRHDFVVMFQNGVRYLIRPPMHFWMVAASYALFGESDFATRLPVALAMVGLTLLTFAFGRKFLSERAGFYGGLVVATSMGMFIFTRTVMPEAIYGLEFTAISYLFLRSWTGSLDPRLGYWGSAVVCALATLTRGLIGLLFPAAIILLFITLTRDWRRWRELRPLSSIAIFLVIAVPWHLLAERRAPGFFWAYFVNEHVNRALGTRVPHDYSAVPLWLWLPEHLIWLFPWSFFAPLVFRIFPSPRTWRGDVDPDAQARLFLFIWTGVILLFFSVEGGSRMEYYSFGAWPALALLIGLGVDRADKGDDRWLLWISRALASLGVLFALATAALLWVTGRPSKDTAADLHMHSSDWYKTSTAHIHDLTARALADLRAPLILAAASLFAALLAAWILSERGRQLASTVAMALGMVGFFAAANIAYRDLEPSFSSRGLALEINRHLRRGDQIALYGDLRVAPGIALYSHHRVLLYNATNSLLEFGSHYVDAPKTFFDDSEFLRLWSGPGRVLLVVPGDKLEEARGKLPKDLTWILASAGGKTVYVNQAN
jgi:4-amino-4-deoxy-L-arabinose transferase-like glycosyltransferase